MSQSQSHQSAIVINITLDGQNYLEWAFTIETTLQGHGLYFHLTDDPPTIKSDNSNAAVVKTWEINDGKLPPPAGLRAVFCPNQDKSLCHSCITVGYFKRK